MCYLLSQILNTQKNIIAANPDTTLPASILSSTAGRTTEASATSPISDAISESLSNRRLVSRIGSCYDMVLLRVKSDSLQSELGRGGGQDRADLEIAV